MSDNPFRKQAEALIANAAELQRQILVKHTTGVLAAIYEDREMIKLKLAAALEQIERLKHLWFTDADPEETEFADEFLQHCKRANE